MLAITLAVRRGIDFRADTAPGEAWMRLQTVDPAFRDDVVVLTDPEREGMMTGCVSVKDLAAARGSILSELPACYRPVIRSNEALTDVARLLTGHGLHHLSVVDEEGRYLGEILRSDVSEALMRMLGFNRAIQGSLLLLQTVETSDPLREIMQSAESAGVRVLGYSELWPEDGDMDGGARPRRSSGPKDAEETDAESPEGSDALSPAVRTLFLHLDTLSPEAVLSTLRRKGYFPISMSPGLGPSEAEMSDRIDQFLHFLTI